MFKARTLKLQSPLETLNQKRRGLGYWISAQLLAFIPGEALILAPRDTNKLRGKLPEPFDLFNHATNLTGTAGFSSMTAMVTTGLLGSSDLLSDKSRRKIAAGLAMGVAIVGNTLAETKFGVKLVAPGSTTDPLDLAYGIVGGIAGTEFALSVSALNVARKAADVSLQPIAEPFTFDIGAIE